MALSAPSARLWVEHYLDTYCVPGQHVFAWASPTRRWCLRCYKEESPADTACMICDASGSIAGTVDRAGALAASGFLCSDCAAGLQEGSELVFRRV